MIVTLKRESFCKSREDFVFSSTVLFNKSSEKDSSREITAKAGFLFSRITCLIAPVDLSTVNADFNT